MSPKTLVAFFGVSAGGIAPFAYMAVKGFQFNHSSSEKTPQILGEQMSWECRIEKFNSEDLKKVVTNSPFFKKIHCYKDQQYDWKIFLPDSIFGAINLDESKHFNLISVRREENMSPIKILQEGKTLSKDWLWMKHINSHNIPEQVGEDLRYLGLYEFEIINSNYKGEKAWVML